MELTYYAGITVPACSKRAAYYSSKLATADGEPAGGDISEITFCIDNLQAVSFTSKRHFKQGPEIYRGKSYIEKGKLPLLDKGDHFTFANLCGCGDSFFSFSVSTMQGVVLLSSGAFEQLRDAIDSLSKELVINERREGLFHHALEFLQSMQKPWTEFTDTYQKIDIFCSKYAFSVFLDLQKLKNFDNYFYRKWFAQNNAENNGKLLLQTELQSLNSLVANQNPLSKIDSLIRLVSLSCNWNEYEAAVHTYGALLALVKKQAKEQCNIVYGLRINDTWGYEECLKNYIECVKELYKDPICYGCFVYYLMLENKIPLPPKFERIPTDLGFEYAYNTVKRDVAPFAKEFFNNLEVLQLEKELTPGSSHSTIAVEDYDLMSGQEFEQAIAEIFKSMGYQVTMTPATGDQGIDIIAVRNGIRIGIQAKCYTGKVGNSAVQEVVAGKQYYNLNRCMVVTNSTFTSAAVELAKANNVTLWDRHVLEEKLLSLND
ncbi:restriction endonuclease [Gemmiger formicilis]|uniref:restriction endonuclease n=1 Tax=Gemmiger formicilis TaxID=745368 RepID=UPI001959D8D0|nr:restriction endonuclease [Gemmiger formicilis]MBM6915003.1 restriction endonuclease [Gemmiger formicilis]